MNAEKILEEKEVEYLRGFLDAATLMNNEAQCVPHSTPAPKPFDILHSRIEDLYSIAAETYDDAVKKKFGIFWTIEKEESKTEEKEHAKTV